MSRPLAAALFLAPLWGAIFGTMGARAVRQETLLGSGDKRMPAASFVESASEATSEARGAEVTATTAEEGLHLGVNQSHEEDAYEASLVEASEEPFSKVNPDDPCNLLTRSRPRQWEAVFMKDNCAQKIRKYRYPWDTDNEGYTVWESPYALGSGMNGVVLEVTLVATPPEPGQQKPESLRAAVKKIDMQKNGGFSMEGTMTEYARSKSGFAMTQYQQAYMKDDRGKLAEYTLSEVAGGSPRDLQIWAPSYTLVGWLFDLIAGKTVDQDSLEMTRLLMGHLVYGLLLLRRGGINHRDIKPDNFLASSRQCAEFARMKKPQEFMERGCYIMYIDFGLGCFDPKLSGDRRLDCENILAGSPAFMAPERLGRQRITSYAGDVFALGVSFYFMLTGSLPHTHFGYQWGQDAPKIQWYTLHHDFSTIPIEGVTHDLLVLLQGMMTMSPDSRLTIEAVWDSPFFNAVRNHIVMVELQARRRPGAPAWLRPKPGVDPGMPKDIVRHVVELVDGVGKAVAGCVMGLCSMAASAIVDDEEFIVDGAGGPRPVQPGPQVARAP